MVIGDKTTRLFDDDAYTRVFTARVISCIEQSGYMDLVLDKTAFFPEAGGQGSDDGQIDGVQVTHVEETKDGIIHHHMPTGTIWDVGQPVTGEIEWESRHRKMQIHSGEHILSGVLYRHYGFANTGFHLGNDEVTVDYNGTLERAQWDKIEREVNDIICQNHKIYCFYPSAETLEQYDYRCKKELTPPIRLVQIGEKGIIDSCACCAPHVAMTGEIGPFKLLNIEHYKGGTRLWLSCGVDAVTYFSNLYRNAVSVSTKWSVKIEEIPEAVERMQVKIYDLQGQINNLNRQTVERMIDTLPPDNHHLCLFLPSIPSPILRQAVNSALPLCQTFCIAFSPKENGAGYDFIMASETVNLQNVAPIIRDTLQSKCGGSSKMIQGSIANDKDTITAFFDSLTV